MKKAISVLLVVIMLFNIFPMSAMASESMAEGKTIKEAEMLMYDKNGKDYYQQFSRFDNPVFIYLAEAYLDNEPQFYLTNAWSNILNEEYRRKGTFKNEYIYDMIIMGFLKQEAAGDIYNESLLSRAKDFSTDLYSFWGDELGTKFEKSKISNSTNNAFDNIQTINDLNLAMSVVDYAEESYDSYLDIMASKMAILESKRDKVALFTASRDFATQIEGDDGYVRVMDSIINAIETSDPTQYLNEKTESACWNTMLKLTEDIIKEVNPALALIDLSVSGIDLVFNSSENASNDIKLAYLYLTERYLRNGMYSITEDYCNDRTSENAKRFIDAFKTLLAFQQYGNNYAEEWLDNYIQVRSGPIKRLFHKKELQMANDMKDQCRNENIRIESMLKDINELEKEEDTWKVILEQKDDESYKEVINKLEEQYGPLEINTCKTGYSDIGQDYRVEADGLCYLELIDFNNDGVMELLAVAKEKSDDDYTVYVYTMEEGHAKEVLASNSVLNNYNDNYRDLNIKTNYNNESFIDGGFAYDGWIYFKIYGMKGNTFGLISASSIIDAYNREDIPRRKYYYILSDPPERINNSDLLQSPEVSEEEYKANIDEWIYNYQFDYKTVSLMYGLSESDAISGYRGTVDEGVLEKAIADTKKLVGINQNSSESGSADTNSWAQAYVDYIEADPEIAFAPEWCTCGLIYIDNDDVPELILEYSNEAAGTRIVSFKNGNTIDHQFVRTGGIQYIEREGFIYNSVGAMGSLIDEFVLLDDDGFHDYGHGFRYGESQDLIHFTQFNWNDVDISEDEYMANISEFDNTRSISWNSYSEGLQSNNYSPDGMCSYLMGY